MSVRASNPRAGSVLAACAPPSDDRNARKAAERPLAPAQQLSRDPDQPGPARRPAVVPPGDLGRREKRRVREIVDVLGVRRGLGEKTSDREQWRS